MTNESTITGMAKAARDAAHKLSRVSSEQKATALFTIAAGLEKEADFIQAENHKDLLRAEEMGLSGAMIDRLTVKTATVDTMVAGLKEVAQLNDPVGTMSPTWIRPNGLQIARMRIPLGVIGIIYESRPNVTVDAAGLCLKAGNAAVLRGGSEAIHSNQAIAACIHSGLAEAGLPEEPPEAAAEAPAEEEIPLGDFELPEDAFEPSAEAPELPADAATSQIEIPDRAFLPGPFPQ